MCKNEVFDLNELHGMMQGRPTRLESKFRLTYSMILNLLRVEELRVEDMMKRSFAELDTQKKQASYKERLQELRKELGGLPDTGGLQYQDIANFYQLASQFLDIKSRIWALLLSHPVPSKAFTPGRIVIINYRGQTNVLALILCVDTKTRLRSFSVLVLSPRAEPSLASLSLQDSAPGLGERQLRFLALARKEISLADVTSSEHAVITIHEEDILHITARTIKIEADKILNDVKKREIPRFKQDPPAASVATAVQQLIKEIDAASGGFPELLDPLRDFRVQGIDLQARLRQLAGLQERIDGLTCCMAPDFTDQFNKVYSVMSVKEEIEKCEYLCSEASLALLPEYHCRINVLQQLQYIDSTSTVQLKGRVACEMGSNELIITELVFNNQLTERPPEEIAALLSSMVFQQRNCSEPELTPSLKKGVEDIKACAEKVGQVQVDCGLLQPVGDYVESFNFGLVEVVYEWARGMPFADITKLTDVQEGVIVRTIQRLDESLRDVKDAARVIGDPVLYQKMDEASTIIKRDIVFAASLYTQ